MTMKERLNGQIRLFGPFEYFIKWSGLNLNYSIIRLSEAKKNGCLLQAIISTILAVLIIGTTAFKFIVVLRKDVKPFTLEWCESNIDMGVLLHGLGAAVCICIWTNSRYIQVFEEKIGEIEQGNEMQNNKFVKNHINAMVMSIILIGVVVVDCGKDVIYGRRMNGTETIDSVPLSVHNIWDSHPIARILSAIASSLSTSLFVLSFRVLNRRMKEFNSDLQMALRNAKMESTTTLLSLSDRHCQLISLVFHCHSQMERFLTTSVIGAMFIHLNAMAISLAHKEFVSWPYLIIIISLGIVSGGLLMLTLRVPGQLQQKMIETSNILLLEKTNWNNNNQEVSKIVNSMIVRSETDNCKMVFCGAFIFDRYLPHKIMLLSPLLGNILILIIKYYL